MHEITVDVEADAKATFVSKGFCIDIMSAHTAIDSKQEQLKRMTDQFVL